MSEVISRTVEIAAPADRVWDMVADLPRMGEISPENTGGRWRGASGPAVGARFVGSNRHGLRRWRTKVVVRRCERGRVFEFDVSTVGRPVARWSYVSPAGDGCAVTESWHDRRDAFVRVLGRVATGIAHDEAETAASIEQTLARLKQRAEGR